MSIKVPKYVYFILAFTICFCVYWPALHGTPIWDDSSFWFNNFIMGPDVPYRPIWSRYVWPLSVALQKLLFSWWEKNYFLYHALGLSLHFVNSFLVYLLAKKLRFKHSLFFFFLFLMHPSTVISVSWMIQLKTLLCFFFAFCSILTMLSAMKNSPRLWPLSWLFFLLSVASKSASVALPLAMIIICAKDLRGARWAWLLPFFLISAWSIARLYQSPATRDGLNRVEKVFTKRAKETAQIKAYGHEIKNSAIPKGRKQNRSWELDLKLLLKTTHYYFWQAVVPLRNEPLRGQVAKELEAEEVIHVLFILLLIIILWKESALYCLLVGYILLLPFLGLVRAPYMSITWISDQHLYLVLPFFLGFWFKLFDKLSFRFAWAFPLIISLFFTFKSALTTPYYKDEITFFEASLKWEPDNVPITYNLAYAYFMEGRFTDSLDLLNQLHERAQLDPEIKASIYWPNTATLHLMVKQLLEPNAN